MWGKGGRKLCSFIISLKNEINKLFKDIKIEIIFEIYLRSEKCLELMGEFRKYIEKCLNLEFMYMCIYKLLFSIFLVVMVIDV